MTLTLSPMSEAELTSRLSAQIAEYADDLIQSGRATEAEARDQSLAVHAALLPDGVRTAGHLVLTAHADDATVGWIWIALPGAAPAARDSAWIYNVEIDPEYRGKGYGRAILQAAERDLIDRGVPRLGLNVFGHNPVAQHLYRSLGFEVTSQQMAKDLS